LREDNMSGKFWEESSEDDEEDFFSSGEESVEEFQEKQQPKPGRWAKGSSLDDDNDDEKREVKAKTEKANEALEKKISEFRNFQSTNDWNGISKEFGNLTKLAQNWQDTWEVDTPSPHFIGYLAELEDWNNQCAKEKDYKKKLSKTNMKTMGTVQQRIKKLFTTYAKQIRTFRFNKNRVEAGDLDESELYAMPKKFEAEAAPSTPAAPAEEAKTPESIEKKLVKIIADRGKKGFDRKEQVSKLEDLAKISSHTVQTLQIYGYIISIQFDASITTHLGPQIWNECLSVLNTILDIVEKDQAVLNQKVNTTKYAPIEISSSLILFLERLEQEYWKSLQEIDHTKISIYTSRMKDITGLLNLTKRILKFYENSKDKKSSTKAAIIYLKYVHHNIKTNVKQGDELRTINSNPEGVAVVSEEEMESLAKLCFTHGDERQKTHGMLYYIASLANRDQFYKARDLMLMSHLQDTILNADVDTQILYNRAMVFIGLCAFRAGKIIDAHNCLSEICSSVRIKELLAQGIIRYSDKDPEQERLESRRQMPFHMYIHLDLVEAVHLVCALLLEVPNSAAFSFDKRKPISRTLKKFIDIANRQVFLGPPETTREVIVAAAKALSHGDWKKCCSLVFSLKAWKLLPNYEALIEMMRQKIKEEGLRTYMFSASSNYDSLSLARLAEMFELPTNTVHSVVSKMMINSELHASWDQPTSSIVMHKVEPNRLQALSLQFSEKIATFVEANERLLESKTSFGKYDPLKDRGNQDQGQWSNRNRYIHKQRYGNQQNQQSNQQSNQQRGGQRFSKDFRPRGAFQSRHNN
jgi:hypothetical protein